MLYQACVFVLFLHACMQQKDTISHNHQRIFITVNLEADWRHIFTDHLNAAAYHWRLFPPHSSELHFFLCNLAREVDYGECSMGLEMG